MLKYVLAFLCLVTPAFAEITDANVVVLLDTSGSMQDSMGHGVKKIQAAQEALVNVLGQVPDTTNVGILTFNGWAVPLSPIKNHRDEVVNAIRATTTAGATPLSQYTQIAGTQLVEARTANRGYGTYKLVIVTDGESTDDGLEKYVADIMSRGISVQTIGVAMPGGHALASLTRYMRADDPESLKSAVSKVLAETHTDNGDNLAEGFDLISGLSEDVSRAIIVSLIDSRSHGIGQPPKEKADLYITNSSGEKVTFYQPPTPDVSESTSVPTWVWLVSIGGVIIGLWAFFRLIS